MNALLLLSVASALTALAAPSLPLLFEENRGQAPASAQFAARGQGYVLLLTPTVATLQRGSDALEMRLGGANASARAEGQDRSAGVSNYYRGRQVPVTGIPNFRRVQYAGVYPGIDLVYYGNGKQLEYDFIVQPGADPAAIALTFNTAARPRLDGGELVLQTSTGELRQHAPVLFQNKPSGRQEIAGGYRIEPNGTVRFIVGDYDHSAPLVIDPTLVYSTYFGGAASDSINGIALDAAGNIHTAGDSQSTSFPVSLLPAPVNNGGMDVLVTKLTPDGGDLLYLTLIGGSSTDYASSIAIDSAGRAIITGYTFSANFPVLGAFQAGSQGGGDGIVMKLNTNGTINWSTYLGGSGGDSLTRVAVDSSDNIFVAGNTTSTNYPQFGGPGIPAPTGASGHGCLTKFTPFGVVAFSTRIGGGGQENVLGLATDAAGNAYIAGATSSTNFPVTASAVQSTQPGSSSAFITKLNATGSTLLYSTYLGGAATSVAMDLAVDAAGSIFVTGANNPDFPGISESASTGKFLTRLNSSGGLVWSRTLPIDPRALIAQSTSRLLLAGIASTSGLPTPAGWQSALAGSSDVYVMQVESPGSKTMFASYHGGTGLDVPTALTARNGNIYLAGYTTSTNVPMRSPIQGTSGGGTDSFLAIAKEAADLALFMSATPAKVGTFGGSVTYRIDVVNGSTNHLPAVTVADTIPAGVGNVIVTTSVGTCGAPGTGFTCSLGNLAPGATAVITVQATIPFGFGAAVNSATVSTTSTDPNLNNNTAQVKSR